MGLTLIRLIRGFPFFGSGRRPGWVNPWPTFVRSGFRRLPAILPCGSFESFVVSYFVAKFDNLRGARKNRRLVVLQRTFASLLGLPPTRLTATWRRLLKTVKQRDSLRTELSSRGRTRFLTAGFLQSPEGSACHSTDARSPPVIPDKVGIRRLSGKSCWSRLNDAISYVLASQGAQ